MRWQTAVTAEGYIPVSGDLKSGIPAEVLTPSAIIMILWASIQLPIRELLH